MNNIVCAIADALSYYRHDPAKSIAQTPDLETLLQEVKKIHPAARDSSLGNVQLQGDAIDKFTDYIPNYAFSMRLTVESNNRQRLNHFLNDKRLDESAFPAGHFDACRKMVDSCPDTALRDRTRDALSFYEAKLRGVVMGLAACRDPEQTTVEDRGAYGQHPPTHSVSTAEASLVGAAVKPMGAQKDH